MFEKFGEFDSAEEINKKAGELRAAGQEKELLMLAEENGIDKEDAEDFMDGLAEELATPLTAALGKLEAEAKDLDLKGIAADWKESIMEGCAEDAGLCAAVRKKGKCLRDCMAALIRFSFENKVQISDSIVKATRVCVNGKMEPLKGPLYLGFPNRAQAKKIIREYYLGQGDGK